MVDNRLYNALQAGQRAAVLGDMPEENIVKSMLGSAHSMVTLPRDVYEGRVDPLSDEGINRSIELAGNLMTGGIGRAAVHPPIGDVELGIFAGPRAKGAPLDALYDAFRMKAHNAHPDEIWKSTGWGELPDKKWMWEISDDLMKLHPNPEGVDKFVGPHFNEKFSWDIPGATEHGPLFEAYPDIAKVLLKRDAKPGRGYSMAPYTALGRKSEGTIGIAPDPVNDLGWTRLDTGLTTHDPESILLHELQHQVQAREGWVPGSSYEITQQRMRDAIMKEVEGGRRDRIPELTSAISDPLVVHNLYQRDLGEMMARATQYRQGFSPLERRQIPPWLDFDKGIENAIVPRD